MGHERNLVRKLIDRRSRWNSSCRQACCRHLLVAAFAANRRLNALAKRFPAPLAKGLLAANGGDAAVEVGSEILETGALGRRENTHGNKLARAKNLDALPHQMAKLPAETVPDDRVTDGPGYDKTDLRGKVGDAARGIRAGPVDAGAVCADCYEKPGRSASNASESSGELRRAPHAVLGSKHVRRKANGDPCDGERRGSRGRRGSTCACGSRAPWPGGGCWAEKSAWSRLFSLKRREEISRRLLVCEAHMTKQLYARVRSRVNAASSLVSGISRVSRYRQTTRLLFTSVSTHVDKDRSLNVRRQNGQISL